MLGLNIQREQPKAVAAISAVGAKKQDTIQEGIAEGKTKGANESDMV